MKSLFDEVAIKCSRLTTRSYSTSFSLGIQLLGKELRDPVYAIYGFVRFADEIVDTFHDYNKEELLTKFKSDTYEAIESGISLNPILNSFQHAVNRYNIDHDLIETFLKSMEMDLLQVEYDQERFEEYILGSAEVVGLMCLKVFTGGDEEQYRQLQPYAMALGSAFQKVNFLRDVKNDLEYLGRSYFPGVNLESLDEQTKSEIEQDIEKDFNKALIGIKKLPQTSQFGVYIAYVYYYALFKKIQATPSRSILKQRIRIPNNKKYGMLVGSYLRYRLNLIR